MINKIFVDTNILVYAHDLEAGAKHRKAAQILEQIWQQKNGVLSIQVIQEFYVTLTRKLKKPLKQKIAKSLVEKYGHWQIMAPQMPQVLAAMDLQRKNRFSFWDAMIVQSALEAECAILLSEDMQHGRCIYNLAIQNPFLIS